MFEFLRYYTANADEVFRYVEADSTSFHVRDFMLRGRLGGMFHCKIQVHIRNSEAFTEDLSSRNYYAVTVRMSGEILLPTSQFHCFRSRNGTTTITGKNATQYTNAKMPIAATSNHISSWNRKL